MAPVAAHPYMSIHPSRLEFESKSTKAAPEQQNSASIQ
jgi:hypothetical protein